MTTPLHYSLELPQRCLQLIEELWPHAEKTRQREHPELGPLTMTFLISMSIPVINLPVERIERYKSEGGQGYADDRHIDVRLAEAVITVLGGQSLKKAPFFIPGTWSFACRDEKSLFNIAQGIPNDLADELGTQQAIKSASEMPTSQWCSILRNAMAHGGIAYLDETGRSSEGQPVKMLAFISGRYGDPGNRKRLTGLNVLRKILAFLGGRYDVPGNRKRLTGLNVLRISEANYRAFLHEWVAWLQDSGLAERAAA